jgi:acyl-CoA synthetase (AMP-forming)/AMP-acid ligase II/acyl carrier protein
VIAGGEASLGERLVDWQQIVRPGIRWLNGYGPTEATITTTLYEPPSEWREPIGTVPIGRPIPNTEVYLLDPGLQPVPIGVPGELYIGGDGLALGYLGRSELTNENFIAHPFSTAPGARLYRSGDMARYRSDGTIEFLGRTDRQIKIRGYRVEVGEVETALAQCHEVRDAMVEAREDVPGESLLVAYLVANDTRVPTVTELRCFLNERLPPYMVPSRFVWLDRLPITPNGKLDRRSLTAVEATRPSLDRPYVPPRTPGEEALADIWREVLGVEQIGVDDDFFALGGHSLLTTRVMSRVRHAFGVVLPLRALFVSPTVAELSVFVLQALVEAHEGDDMAQMLADLEALP